MKTPIIIAVHNELDLTKRCIRSVKENTNNYELVIVDNNSTDGKVIAYCENEGARVLRRRQNSGKTIAVNQAIRYLEEQDLITDFIVLDNDTVVYKGWLEKLKEVLNRDSWIGAVGPVTNKITGGFQLVRGLETERFNSPTLMNAISENGFIGRQKQYRVVNFLVFFCVLFRYEMIKNMGILDSDFPWRGEDNEYALRIEKSPWKMAVRQDCFVFHEGGATRRKKEKVNKPEYINEVVETLRKKYNGRHFPTGGSGEIVSI